MKAKVIYTITANYDYFTDDLIKENNIDNENLKLFIENWIKEDFYKIENRADSILPDYKSELKVEVEDG